MTDATWVTLIPPNPRDDVFSYPMFRDLERCQTVFTGIASRVHPMQTLRYA